MSKKTITPLFNNQIEGDTQKRRFRQQYTESTHIPDMEENTLPSQTIPGMSMSISEMLSRTQRGLPISGLKTPVYNGERLLPNWQKLDLIDRANVVAQAHEDIKNTQKKLENQKARIAIRQAEAAKKLEEDNKKPITVTNG